MAERKRKILAAAGIGAFLLLFLAAAWYAGRPMLRFVREPDKFRAWVDEGGILSDLLFVGMVILQVFIAIIPGEPLEIAAGYAFGAVEGTVLCVIGVILGSALVFAFVRKYGVKAVEVFFSREKINPLKFISTSKRLNLLTFVLMFIPGTPKDIISYFVGLTNMKFLHWMLIAGVARLPSIVTSTVGGSALGDGRYKFAIFFFAATALLSLAGLGIYTLIQKKRS